MRELDKDGRLLCEMQGKIFEKSAEAYGTSSAVFIRRYMNSDYAGRMDKAGFIDRPTDESEAFHALDEQYGPSSYGKTVYSRDELFWIGYLYRYWAYTYEISSRRVYKTANAFQMHSVYYILHTMDPSAAIIRLLEGKNSLGDEEGLTEKGVRILRQIRNSKKQKKAADIISEYSGPADKTI